MAALLLRREAAVAISTKSLPSLEAVIESGAKTGVLNANEDGKAEVAEFEEESDEGEESSETIQQRRLRKKGAGSVDDMGQISGGTNASRKLSVFFSLQPSDDEAEEEKYLRFFRRKLHLRFCPELSDARKLRDEVIVEIKISKMLKVSQCPLDKKENP